MRRGTGEAILRTRGEAIFLTGCNRHHLLVKPSGIVAVLIAVVGGNVASLCHSSQCALVLPHLGLLFSRFVLIRVMSRTDVESSLWSGRQRRATECV